MRHDVLDEISSGAHIPNMMADLTRTDLREPHDAHDRTGRTKESPLRLGISTRAVQQQQRGFVGWTQAFCGRGRLRDGWARLLSEPLDVYLVRSAHPVSVSSLATHPGSSGEWAAWLSLALSIAPPGDPEDAAAHLHRGFRSPQQRARASSAAHGCDRALPLKPTECALRPAEPRQAVRGNPASRTSPT